MQVPLFRLQCGVNSYDWGKKGTDSAVARFAAATPSDDFSIQADKTYSELWMGSHPSNPSRHLETGRSLLDLFSDNQALLSQGIAAKYGPKLPFLFKVLSIDKALSIQAHPDKTLAEQLHARDPKNYPDDNHKPEMVIAVTPFEGLCGFRPLAEIAHFLDTVPPLRRLVGDDTAARFVEASKLEAEGDEPAKKYALKAAFAALMASSDQDIAREVSALAALAATAASDACPDTTTTSSSLTPVLAELVGRLHAQYGADIGIMVLFFLNYVTLSPGEALFLVADDIHAYISGDAVECMAASDNVVRCGLTPKFRDVPTLVDMLTYNYAPIEQQKMAPADYPFATLNRAAYSSGSSVLLYDPPIEEFGVVRACLRGARAKATFDPIDGPSVVICTAGRGTIAVGPTRHEMREGYVFFVGATAECVLESAEGEEEEEFTTFKAFCDLETAS